MNCLLDLYIFISANEWFSVPRKCSCKNWANNMYMNISLEIALVDACSFSIVRISNWIFDRRVRNICRIRLFTDSLFMYNSLKKKSQLNLTLDGNILGNRYEYHLSYLRFRLWKYWNKFKTSFWRYRKKHLSWMQSRWNSKKKNERKKEWEKILNRNIVQTKWLLNSRFSILNECLFSASAPKVYFCFNIWSFISMVLVQMGFYRSKQKCVCF